MFFSIFIRNMIESAFTISLTNQTLHINIVKKVGSLQIKYCIITTGDEIMGSLKE